MIIWGLLSYFDLLPFYQVRLYKVNSLTPTISFFPSAKLRLNFDSHEATSRQDINSALWHLVKDNNVLFTEEGLEPTITLPTATGGTYQLQVVATMSDNSIKKGQINFYVVQDSAKKVTFSSPTKVDLTTENSSPALIKSIQTNGAEVYTSGQWSKVPTASTTANQVTMEFKPNDSVSSFNSQILIRAQGVAKDLSNYGAVQVPSNTTRPRY
jgi:hypothetical protein